MAGWDTRPHFFHTEYPKIQVGICTRTPQLGLYKLHYLSRGSTGIHWCLSHSVHLGVGEDEKELGWLPRQENRPWCDSLKGDRRPAGPLLLTLLMMHLSRSPGPAESLQDSAVWMLSLFHLPSETIISNGHQAEIRFERIINLVPFFLFLWPRVFPSLAFYPSDFFPENEVHISLTIRLSSVCKNILFHINLHSFSEHHLHDLFPTVWS